MKRVRKTKKVKEDFSKFKIPTTAFDLSKLLQVGAREAMDKFPNKSGSSEMPDWAANILQKLCLTILKPIIKLKPEGKIDWRSYGRMVGLFERYKVFLKTDVFTIFAEKGLADLSEKQWKKIEPQLGLDSMRDEVVRQLNRQVADNEPLEELCEETMTKQISHLEKLRQNAFAVSVNQNAADAGLFMKGFAEGFQMFLNSEGKFAGDRGLTEIYQELLAHLPEIEKMRRAVPARTRRDLYVLLSKSFKFLPSQNLVWFNDVCDGIKLSIGTRGRPKAKRKQ